MKTTIVIHPSGKRLMMAHDYADGITIKGEPVRNGPAKLGGKCFEVNFSTEGYPATFKNLDTGEVHLLMDFRDSYLPCMEAITKACMEEARRTAIVKGKMERGEYDER